MMYTVTARFADLEDSSHIYEIGDAYPREGYAPSAERIDALLTDKNRVRKRLIQATAEVQSSAVETAEEKQPKKRTKKNA